MTSCIWIFLILCDKQQAPILHVVTDVYIGQGATGVHGWEHQSTWGQNLRKSLLEKVGANGRPKEWVGENQRREEKVPSRGSGGTRVQKWDDWQQFGTGRPRVIVLHFMAFHRCGVLHKTKARPSTSNKIMTRCIAVIWNQSSSIAEACLHSWRAELQHGTLREETG